METLIKSVLESEKTKREWRNNYNSVEWKNANKLNKELFGIALNQSIGCQCLEDLFFYIKRPNFVKNKTMEKNKLFRIKEGRIMTVHGFPPMSNNTPDEVFIKVLKSNPAHINSFVSYPPNWKDIVNGKAGKTKAVKAEPLENAESVFVMDADDFTSDMSNMTIDQLREICDEKGIKYHHKSKEQKLIELINNA